MYANIDEMEIKVEYCETFDVDPLRDNRKQIIDNKLDINASIVAYRTLNKEELLNHSDHTDNIDSVIHQEHTFNETIVKTKWYKLVTDSGKYVCNFCDLVYTTVQTLRNHVKLKHPQKYAELKNITITSLRKKKLKCHICTKKFENTLDLQDHIKCHGLDNIQTSCSICHASFKTAKEILSHVTSEHKRTIKKIPHICFICGYSTQKLSHYKQHENTHRKDSKTKCLYCNYSTNYLPNLRIHERIHTNDKPYICSEEQCDYRCATKSALSSHQLKHDKEKYMLYCDKCSYSTVYKQSLKKHMDSHSRNSVRKR